METQHDYDMTLDILRKIRKLLERPENWTRCAYARDKDGTSLSSYDEKASSFCLLGAVSRASYEMTEERLPTRDQVEQNVKRGLESAAQVRNLSTWNDDPQRTHGEVLELIDKVIEEFQNQKKVIELMDESNKFMAGG